MYSLRFPFVAELGHVLEGDGGADGRFLVALQKAVARYKCDPEWPAMLKARDQGKEASSK